MGEAGPDYTQKEVPLEEVSKAIPTLKWEKPSISAAGDRERYFDVNLPGSCYMRATIYDGENPYLKIINLQVPTRLKGNGIAKRLVRSAAVVAKEQGIHRLESDIISANALKVRRSVFGESHLDIKTISQNPQPLSYQEALDLLSTGELPFVSVVTDFSDIDMSDASLWERPQEEKRI